MKLTELSVHNLDTGRRYSVWDDSLPGFGLRVNQRTKSFVIKQANRYHLIGRYPLISLKQARDEAKRRLASKYFPQASKLTHEAIQEYTASKLTEHRPGTRTVYQSYLKRLENRPLSDVDVKYIHSVLPEAKSASNLAFAVYKAFLSWCVERDYIQTNPLLGRKKLHKTKSRERLVTDAELREIFRETFNHGEFGKLIRCLYLSGQRISQFSRFNPEWIKGDTIEFPPEAMKTGRAHHIPCTPTLKENLPTKHIYNISTSMVKFRQALPHIPHFTNHDARRYVSSTCAALKVPQEVVEKLLSHTTGKTTPIAAVYNRHSYAEELRSALRTYEEHLEKIGLFS
jgi:integrase